ncbi:MAG: DUF167 domain-containing protein [Pseudomonadota bacterium]|nr:DUF167 domain-containing protein [Pseudomonadota bacterium]
MLHVIPKASKNEIVGWVAGADGKRALKVKIAAAPEDGKANKALIRFLAGEWDVSPSMLEIASGGQSRHKRLKIHDENVLAKLPR